MDVNVPKQTSSKHPNDHKNYGYWKFVYGHTGYVLVERHQVLAINPGDTVRISRGRIQLNVTVVKARRFTVNSHDILFDGQATGRHTANHMAQSLGFFDHADFVKHLRNSSTYVNADPYPVFWIDGYLITY